MNQRIELRDETELRDMLKMLRDIFGLDFKPVKLKAVSGEIYKYELRQPKGEPDKRWQNILQFAAGYLWRARYN
jgi:hypothetical protein